LLIIEDISRENLDPALTICSINRPFATINDPVLVKARDLKRQWLLEMLEKHGPCMKIAYLDGKAVAQILFYPETAIPYIHNPREGAIYLKCTFNISPETRGKGVGNALMKSLIEESHQGLDCLGGRPCQFIVTKPFPHEGDLPLADFYEKHGFIQSQQEMFLEVEGEYMPMEIPELNPLPEDRGRTIITYSVDCEWGYYFVITAPDLIQKKYPHHSIETFDIWKEPDEYKKRGGGWMLIAAGILVNARVPENPFIFWVDREAFLRNVEKAMIK